MSTHPCEMFTDFQGRKLCGQPATLGAPSEFDTLLPMCNDCIRWTGTKRRYLKPLPDKLVRNIIIDETPSEQSGVSLNKGATND